MDIKSKNIKYSTAMKAVAVSVIWISLAGVFSSAFYAFRYTDMLNSDDFYKTSAFLGEFRQYTDYAVDYAVRLRSEDYIKEGRTITADTFADTSTAVPKIQLGSRDEKEATGPDEVAASETSTKTEPANPEIKPTAEDEAIKLKEREEYIDQELQRFRDLEKQLSAIHNYAYVVTDSSTGFFVTNMDGSFGGLQGKIEAIKKQPFNVYISKDRREVSYIKYSSYLDNMRESFKGTSFELYAAAMEPFRTNAPFYESWKTYCTVREYIPLFIVIASVSFVMGIAALIYLIAVAGRREKGGQIVHGIADSMYMDVQTLLVMIAAWISANLAISTGYNRIELAMAAVTFVLLSVDMFIGLTFILSIARHIKSRTLFRHTLIYAIGKALAGLARKCMEAKTFKISVLLLLLAYGLLNCLFFTALVTARSNARFFAFLAWAALNTATVIFVAKALLSLSDIMKWVRRISSGGLEELPDMKSISPAFSGLANDVGNIQSGLKNAVFEAVKSERLKAELITNVSHDLKTPLTSIINYVDLLKNEETDNENIKQYAGILTEKSDRLKQLIEDLMEASKAASGNVTINMESIDMHSLVLQAAAEFGEKASDAGLDIRIKPVEQPVHIHADGKLMWRIMENLFSNVVKYSQRNSRVYLEAESMGGFGTVTVKNISEAPLDIPADQLMERFVRGDRSRATEGSGLGLAIARSLAEVQGGGLGISIDGDLFKVSVKIPLENQ